MKSGGDTVSWYRLLLLILPSDFRRDFGGDMEQLLMDRLRESGSTAARIRLRGAAAADLVGHAVREWTARAAGVAQEQSREGWGMEGLRQDIRFGFRSLRRRPGFTMTAVLTLALGIGANVAIFSVVNTVLLRPLPYPDSESLHVLQTEDMRTGELGRGVDHPDVRAIQAAIPELSVAGVSGTRPTLTGFGPPQVLFGSRVTDGLIRLMGLEPAIGRDLVAEDDIDGGPKVVVLGHAFWVEQLGADPSVLGRTISLNGDAWEIVGVAPEGFDYPSGSELWLPRRHESEGCDHGCRIMSAVARVAPEASVENVQQRLRSLSVALSEDFPNSHTDVRFALEPMLDYEVAEVRSALWVLLGAVGLVLLIACANVANLLLARANARKGEIALRAALGASRVRVVRQLLTESALLSVAGGIFGLGLALWGTRALVGLAPASMPRMESPTLDPTVLGFAALLVFSVTAIFGTLPALQVTRRLGADASGPRRVAGDRQAETSRAALLVAEVALSLTLLLGTGLLIRTLGEIRDIDLGFETEGIERFRVSIPDTRYDSLAVGDLLEEMEAKLTAIPGVEVAGWGFGVPFASGSIGTTVSFLDRPELPPFDRPELSVRPASPGFLAATGTRLARGRWFESTDRYGAERVAVINEAVVRTYFPDSDPIGVQIDADVSWGFENVAPFTIVGVVEDVIRVGPTELPEAAVYLPNAQFGVNTGYVSLRLRPGVETVIPQAREVVATLDPSLAIWNVGQMSEIVASQRSTTRFYTTLLSVFSIVALLLAAVGLYGVVAYSVTQRTREIGIRIALGAARNNVTAMVLRQGIKPALLGILVGLGASWLGARTLGTMLFGVTWWDPLTLGSVTIILLAVTAAATVLPARRAARVSPASALSAE